MITAKVCEDNHVEVELKGNIIDITAEFTSVMTNTTIALAENIGLGALIEDEGGKAESVLFAAIMATCKNLKKRNIDCDPKRIAISMLADVGRNK